MVGDELHETDVSYTCPVHGREGILDFEYDLDRVAAAWDADPLVRRFRNQWRYRELLPIPDLATIPPVPVGWTPVWEAPRLAASIGVRRVWLKDDGRNPTASLKDRASAVGVARARGEGARCIACASTGNAASSLAGAAAAAGMDAVIFVPERAPEPKVAQLMVFGATVFRVQGTYEEAYDLCEEVCEEFGWANRNCAVNPVLVEGKKTAGLEIAEHFRDGPPDWVVVSVGDGCTVAGIAKGLLEYAAVTGTGPVPRVLGVQARGAAPLVRAFESGEPLAPVSANTVADSIAVGTPRNWRKAIRYLNRVHGEMVTVKDEAIDEAMKEMARLGGSFGEPAAAASLAGLRGARERGIVGKKETAVVLITGNGLKDTGAAIRAAGEPHRIPPTAAAVRDRMKKSRA